MTTKLEVLIRPAETKDAERLQQLWDSTGLERAAADEWEALLSGRTTAVLVAEEGGKVIGTAIASYDGWRAYIYHVGVAASHRRSGVAFDLMGQAEQYLMSAGARFVYVMVHQDNTEGMALVGSTGYLPEGEIVLAKRLATRPA
ncbi:MAG: GNAT family N-acetyltransferase [Dehalococcoidia bacterium]|nr:GNAT family N-acetyltransferase [Dehalococcoidia bacterium]MCA9829446.1 GNAT family N-acetyltransferase [Dehalococcoidia bacterium]